MIFRSHCSPFGRYNSIDGCNFANLRTAGLGPDEDADDGGFTGSGTGAREGIGLDDDEDAAPDSGAREGTGPDDEEDAATGAGAVDGATADDERLFGFEAKSFGRKLPASRDTGALNEKTPSRSVS